MRKASAVLLTAAVVVLGLVAFAPKPPPEPTAVALMTTDVRHIYRLWSDGTVELNIVNDIASGCFRFGWCGWQVVPEESFP